MWQMRVRLESKCRANRLNLSPFSDQLARLYVEQTRYLLALTHRLEPGRNERIAAVVEQGFFIA